MPIMTKLTVPVHQDLLADKKQQAQQFREACTAAGTLVVNLVSSPGAGKTSLLEATARHWAGKVSMAVLVGDLATERDADRLRPLVPVQQLTTGGACHLDITLIHRGLGKLPEQKFDVLFIENIGNLVCPASHDLGEHLRVVLLSVPEGDDKPGKYPKMFRSSHALLITKTDLLPWVPFSPDAAFADARNIQPNLHTLQLSAPRNIGIAAWCDWLLDARTKLSAPGQHSS
ncbi:MAG: Hydrogenase isoenzyme nickel incorporation protein HypB [Planctomycetota bacterium]|jgi:hydrogenase nickel incorporation protein HypB